jgi:hypothetical protein
VKRGGEGGGKEEKVGEKKEEKEGGEAEEERNGEGGKKGENSKEDRSLRFRILDVELQVHCISHHQCSGLSDSSLESSLD